MPFEETGDDLGLIDLFVALDDDTDNFGCDVALSAATGFHLRGARCGACGNVGLGAAVHS